MIHAQSPPETPETAELHRRGSAVSTSSGQSLPLTYPRAPSSASASLKRRSVSSFGAYTIHTVGDMSMSSSMPLLERDRRSVSRPHHCLLDHPQPEMFG